MTVVLLLPLLFGMFHINLLTPRGSPHRQMSEGVNGLAGKIKIYKLPERHEEVVCIHKCFHINCGSCQ